MANSLVAKMNQLWRWRSANVSGFVFEFSKLLTRSTNVFLTTQLTGVCFWYH